MNSKLCEEEKIDKELFINEIKKRNIKKLVHFTTNINLYNIIHYRKIISRKELEESDNLNLNNADYTDELRLDGTDHINCSIEYINKYMLNTKKTKGDDGSTFFCILFIDPKYIYRKSTKFSITNAANSYNKKYVGIDGTFNKFLEMFQDKITVKNAYSSKTKTRYQGMNDNMTTDLQAEVLVYDHIPSSDILNICFQNEAHMKIAKSIFNLSKISVDESKFIVDPSMFN